MSQQVASLRIKKKITAFLADGTQKMNLGIPSVKEMLAGLKEVKVQVDMHDADAKQRFHDLAEECGLHIQATEGEDEWLLLANVQPLPADTQLEATVPHGATDDRETGMSPAHAAPYGMTPAIAQDVQAAAGALDTSDLGGSEVITAAPRDTSDLERLYPPTTQLVRNGTIVLGAQEIFSDCEKAYAYLTQHLRDLGVVTLPKRYHADLTQTFFKGSVEGQIHSVFKDLKKFGMQAKVMGKVQNLLQYADQAADPSYRTFIYFLKHKMLPHHTITFKGGRISSSYFKFWFMFELLKREGHFEFHWS